ncbi:hypothetical protein [Clostridium perfringens]|uniref:Uncharacterized protein n=1 Tax=Clostridium perfringens TaxID=1502 RepID=A0AAW4IZK6_CLOPF|nr:hypothetical protein [Clostridium perfringens]MBO3356135.1 hypothetical protein [Clostridium perfringens]MBO3359524.1 hypothetical protein [Clostridium perfringens]
MIVKLIKNPWVSDILPEGLTLGNTYKCTEIFNSNPYDEYFRIVNDNGEEDAWNSCCFEVIEGENKEKHNSMLKEIEKMDKFLSNMSSKEFDNMLIRNGYGKEEYKEEPHKTWFKSLSETKEEIKQMAENIDYCEKEVLLTAAFHYLEEYEQLLSNK